MWEIQDGRSHYGCKRALAQGINVGEGYTVIRSSFEFDASLEPVNQADDAWERARSTEFRVY